MPPYPVAEWSREPRWWATGGSTETSRKDLAAAWVIRAGAPKPDKKEYRDELVGWSGVLAERSWVSDAYSAEACLYAKLNRTDDLPDVWDAVSRLYREVGDGLARFSAAFAAIADAWRPAGLPNRLSESVRSYRLRVPPKVRAAMAGPCDDDGGGGVVDDQQAVKGFLVEPDVHVAHYRTVAAHAYAAILAQKAEQPDLFDPESRATIESRIRELCPTAVLSGSTRSVPDDAARERATELVGAEIERYPWLRSDDQLGEAWRRSVPVIARWLADGRPVHHAGIIHTKLKHAAVDERRTAKRLEREQPTVPTELPEPPSRNDTTGSTAARDIVERMRAALTDFALPAPDGSGDSWEKRYASDVLANASTFDPAQRVASRVRADWPAAGPPPNAVRRSGRRAAELVECLLFFALTSVTDPDDAREIAGTGGDDLAARIAATHRTLDRLRSSRRDEGRRDDLAG